MPCPSPNNPLPKREESVRAAGQPGAEAALCGELARKLRRRRQSDVLLIDAARAYRAGIHPSVAGIDDDRRNPPLRWSPPPGGLSRGRTKPRSAGGAEDEPAQNRAPPTGDVAHAPESAAGPRPNENLRLSIPTRLSQI